MTNKYCCRQLWAEAMCNKMNSKSFLRREFHVDLKISQWYQTRMCFWDNEFAGISPHCSWQTDMQESGGGKPPLPAEVEFSECRNHQQKVSLWICACLSFAFTAEGNRGVIVLVADLGHQDVLFGKLSVEILQSRDTRRTSRLVPGSLVHQQSWSQIWRSCSLASQRYTTAQETVLESLLL